MIKVLADHGRRTTATDQELFNFVVAVAEGTVPGHAPPVDVDTHVEQIRHWISEHTAPFSVNPSGMRVNEFITQCEKAGCKVQKSKGSGWLIHGLNDKLIRIAGSTRKLEGPVIKRYVGMLGLSEGNSGIPFSEFQSGMDGDRHMIVQYMSVFQWLAAT